jgi:isoleucyl-tRNA synthetase
LVRTKKFDHHSASPTRRGRLSFQESDILWTAAMTTTKPEYKKTLNLPKTDFPMKANLAQNEPLSIKRWEQAGLYHAAMKARAGAKAFVFHDGPPYANGAIHVGHLLNKVLKDFVVRSNLMAGRLCPYIPGWDCHGLPIEHKVMTELVESGKAARLDSLSEDQRRMAIRRECQRDAEKFVKLQAQQMQRLLTLADYEHPYLTMSPPYEQAVLEVFAGLLEQGLVYRALKAVHWSIANETALAEAELEYMDRDDLSVYVTFDAAEPEAAGRVFGVGPLPGVSFMIWTTTPWTLPANLAIAVNPKFTYALVEIDGKAAIIANDLVEKVTKAAKSKSARVLAEVGGGKLVGLKYRHPFCDRVSPVVAAEYVTLEDGTGLVHTAPGHGEDDYQTGLREGLDIYCPVRKDGTYDDTVPDWLHGQDIWMANPRIVEHLRGSGNLFFSHPFTHSYPHDWRSKTPVIFRATEQWFIGVDRPTTRDGRSLRQLAQEAAEQKVAFYPDWGRNRMRGMIESRPDWCISRQRSWGLPIPAFFGPDEGQVLLTAASVRAVAKVFGEKGSDAWFLSDVSELLKHYDVKNDPDAPDWVRRADFSPSERLSKGTDIFDVWFESGSSWHAVMRRRDLGFPADLYLEGSDQHRGWFQLSLLPSLGVTGQPPFRALLTHGFMVDKDGRKMSKSLGNDIKVEDLLKSFGAEVCRWWVSSLAFENDIKIDASFIEVAGETYRKVRNTLRFLLSNLFDQDGAASQAPNPPATSIDACALAAAATLQRDVMQAYEQYEFKRVNQLLYDFCNDTLSAFYCAAVKDRLYCDRADSSRRRQTQAVMRQIMELLCRLLAPILPHTADEAYRTLWKDDTRCVHLQPPVKIECESDGGWPRVLEARAAALKALEEAKSQGVENPLDAEVVLPDADGVLKKFAADLPDMLGVSRVRLVAAGSISVNDLRAEARCERSWKRDGTVKQRSDGGMLCDRCAEAVGV